MDDLTCADFTRTFARTTGARFHANSRLPDRPVSRDSFLPPRGRLQPPAPAMGSVSDEKQGNNTEAEETCGEPRGRRQGGAGEGHRAGQR
jgi:hypothetical protein